MSLARLEVTGQRFNLCGGAVAEPLDQPFQQAVVVAPAAAQGLSINRRGLDGVSSEPDFIPIAG
jgi:hypothetical protein